MVLRHVFTRGALASCLRSLLLWVDEQSWSQWPQIQAGPAPTRTGWGWSALRRLTQFSLGTVRTCPVSVAAAQRASDGSVSLPVSGAQRPARKRPLGPESPVAMAFRGASAAPGAAGGRVSSFLPISIYLYFILFEMCKSRCVSVTWDLLALGVVLPAPASRSVSQDSRGCPPPVP